MTLDKVKYRKCNECGRGMPLAHWIRPDAKTTSSSKRLPDSYKKHKNMRCPCCIRSEMAKLEKEGTGTAMARFRKLAKMLGPA